MEREREGGEEEGREGGRTKERQTGAKWRPPAFASLCNGKDVKSHYRLPRRRYSFALLFLA